MPRRKLAMNKNQIGKSHMNYLRIEIIVEELNKTTTRNLKKNSTAL